MTTQAIPPKVLQDDFGIERVEGPQTSLLDAVDRVVHKGAVVRGDVVLAVADVDLIRLNLNLLLAAVETLDQAHIRRAREAGQANAAPPGPQVDLPPCAQQDPVAVPARTSGTDSALRSGPRPAAPPPPAPYGVAAAPTPGKAHGKPDARIALDPKSAEKGVARLVLTLVEFVRQLLERQAIRRMDGGLLDEPTIERMGEALARIEAKVLEMKSSFGLEGEELDIDLGPLGRLNGPGGGER